MRLRARPELRFAALLLIGVACLLTLRAARSPSDGQAPAPPPTAAGLVGDVHPAVDLGDLMIVVLRAPSVAARLPPGRVPSEAQERSWSAEDEAAQQQVLSELSAHGLGVRPAYSFVRVLDGFSARLDPRAVALLQRDPEIAGVYPVRVAYPATLSVAALPSGEPALGAGVALPGLDGSGVEIALLDTGVDLGTAYLGGRVGAGIDIVGGSPGARARRDPLSPHTLETHGTELAGLLVGSGGPGGLQGIAPAATLLPIRVAGWQPDGHGGEALYGRSDELIAGLDRAVDPSGAGDVEQAARVALIGLAEPYAAFADTPEAQAVAGALALGTLVVAPAGNDGAAGPWYGSLAGPGGSPAALTVGAIDSRPETSALRVVVHDGLDVVSDGLLPLLAGAPAGGSLALPLAGPGASVSGAAVLVRAGGDPAAAIARAVAAGARAVLLTGEAPPAGSLGGLAVPVVFVPAAGARALASLLADGASLEASLGGVRGEPNAAAGALAPFSSGGLAFDGRVDPELSAPGVDLATANPRGSAQPYAVVSGTSVAAASVAGAAALLLQSRPGLRAADAASLLAGSSAPGGFALLDGGEGALDLGAAGVGEVAASATSLGFGPVPDAGWSAERQLTLHDVSGRSLRIAFDTGSRDLRVVPARLRLAVGARATVHVLADAAATPASGLAAGTLAVLPAGGEPLRIPWTIVFQPPAATLLGAAALTPASFTPSDTRPAILRVAVGALGSGSRLEIEPAARLEIRLLGPSGSSLGVLATVQDLLPGRYRFAISGRAPDGRQLAPGAYELALVAWPVLGGAPSRTRVALRIQ